MKISGKKTNKLLFLFGLLCVLAVISTGVSFYKNSVVPAHAFKIMTFNIGRTQEIPEIKIETLVPIIKKESPDIVLLQEAYLPKAKKMAELAGYRMLSLPGEKRQHVRILSRYPVQFIGAKKLSDDDNVGKDVVCAEVDTDRGLLLACSVYLTSIRTELGKEVMNDTAKLVCMSLKEVLFESKRSREVKELVDWLASFKYENIVIGGDFNSLFLSKAGRKMRKVFHDSAWLSPALFVGSHKTQEFHLPVKVDYIFLSNNLSSSGTKIIPESPGDHFPVVTNILLN